MAGICDTAVAAGNFKTLYAATKAAGLVETLNTKGPFTVFAPTDEAFAKLPAGTVESLLKDIPKLKSILTYHVVEGKVLAADAAKLKTAKTLQGQELKIDAARWHLHSNIKINDANVIKADVMADNGVIHVIDKVLMPKSPGQAVVSPL
ncbi:MAG: fasciclin domain-containing protein [Candidatus Bathyarchaeota archaeon]|nr:fasciclin domain-containing protein [Candidatus Bathyarchaeota archaeon]